MRTLEPMLGRRAPAGADLDAALDRAERGELTVAERGELKVEEGAAIPVDAGALARLRRVCRLLEGRAPFSHRDAQILRLDLSDSAGERVGLLSIARDGSVRWQRDLPPELPSGGQLDGALLAQRAQQDWSGYADVEEPRGLLLWLAELGVTAPLEVHDAERSAEGRAAREAFFRAAPEALRELVARAEVQGDAPLPASFFQDAEALVAPRLRSFFRRGATVRGLLRWYGHGRGPLDRRPGYEALPRVFLRHVGLDRIVAAIPGLADELERRGAARRLLDAALTPPDLALLERIPGAAREALVAALERGASAEEGERLRGVLSVDLRGAPAGTELAGVSETGAIHRPVTDGEVVVAIDGSEVVRLAGSGRALIARTLLRAPLALHDGGVLLFAVAGAIEKRSMKGKLLAQLPAASDADVARARAIVASWRRGPAGPGAAGPGAAGPGAAAGLAPIEVDAEACEAFEAFAHLGVPPPALSRFAHRWFIDPARPALVRQEGAGGPALEVPLPGRPLHVAAVAGALVLALAVGERCAVAWVSDGGELHATAALDLRPRDVRRVLAGERAAFLLVRVPLIAGERLLRVARPS
ncbi:hypothetical protein ACMHYB_57170 [Sorangium sp. So ce1128]